MRNENINNEMASNTLLSIFSPILMSINDININNDINEEA